MHQQRVGQHLGEDDVGLVKKHHGLAETLARSQDLHDFFRAVARAESKFHLAVDDDVKARTRIALAEQDAARGHAHLRSGRSDALHLIRGQVAKKKQIPEKLLDLDGAGRHSVLWAQSLANSANVTRSGPFQPGWAPGSAHSS